MTTEQRDTLDVVTYDPTAKRIVLWLRSETCVELTLDEASRLGNLLTSSANRLTQTKETA